MREIKAVSGRIALFFVLTLAAVTASVSGQSTIFNIPSTDVMGEKRFYIEGDFIAHLDKWNKGGFQTFGYRTVYGVNRKFEVGANFFYTRNGKTSPKEFQPNAKLRIFAKEKYGLASTAGVQVFVPLNRSAGKRTFAVLYTNLSKTIKQTRGTRITGGFYRIVGATRDFGTRNGAIVGIEQPVKGKLNFTADWYSGKNRFGYAAAGFSYSFKKRQILMMGYNFGNTGRANNSFFTFYGFTY